MIPRTTTVIALLLLATARAHAQDSAPSDHAEQILEEARSAAREHQCDAVAEYGAQLRRLDPGAAETFANDPVIASCTQPLLTPSMVVPSATVPDFEQRERSAGV